MRLRVIFFMSLLLFSSSSVCFAAGSCGCYVVLRYFFFFWRGGFGWPSCAFLRPALRLGVPSSLAALV